MSETPLADVAVSSAPRTLIVSTHLQHVSAGWDALLERLKKDTHFSHRHCSTLSHSVELKEGLVDSAVRLRARIDEKVLLSGPYQSIVLIGVGIAGLVVRQTWLLSLGCYADVPVTVPWARQVTRIVLIATPNRGMGLDFVPGAYRDSFRVAMSIGAYLNPKQRWVTDLLSGSDFLTDLKIRWIRYLHEDHGHALPDVVQLLPTRTGFMRRSWMIDQTQFPLGAYLDIADADINELQSAATYDKNSTRWALLASAVGGELRRTAPPSTSRAARVVFVLHGIRAGNTGWVSQASTLIKTREPATEVVIATYGYYSLLRFPFGLLRRRHVRWFQDLYSYTISKHPDATFFFIGHSLGTYIFGRSLANVPAMRFERAVLVGSVLPREYAWSERIDAGQVRQVLNARSSRDIPVKVMCSALHAFGGDVGTGGVDGFDEGLCRETFYYDGDHSRPLDEDSLPALVEYALTGTFTPPSNLVRETSRRMDVLARLAPTLGILTVLALTGLAYVGWHVGATYGLSASISMAVAVAVLLVLLDAI